MRPRRPPPKTRAVRRRTDAPSPRRSRGKTNPAWGWGPLSDGFQRLMAALLVTLWSLAGVLPPAGAQGTDPVGRLLLVLAEAFGWEGLGDPTGSALGAWGRRAGVGGVSDATVANT